MELYQTYMDKNNVSSFILNLYIIYKNIGWKILKKV
jgi:hypothetical protein